jgi:hypothetical protein
MERANPPGWAGGARELWSPHHIIPVEAQRHWVFDILRETPEGWDHHALVNGIALPRTLAAQAQTRTVTGGIVRDLPIHQVTRELRPNIAPGTLQDVAFHPVYNERVWQRLNALEHLRGDPDALRTAVYDLISDLRRQITQRGRQVLL